MKTKILSICSITLLTLVTIIACNKKASIDENFSNNSENVYDRLFQFCNSTKSTIE